MIWFTLACLLIVAAQAEGQIVQTESSSEHNMLYQIIVPKSNKRVIKSYAP